MTCFYLSVVVLTIFCLWGQSLLYLLIVICWITESFIAVVKQSEDQKSLSGLQLVAINALSKPTVAGGKSRWKSWTYGKRKQHSLINWVSLIWIDALDFCQNSSIDHQSGADQSGFDQSEAYNSSVPNQWLNLQEIASHQPRRTRQEWLDANCGIWQLQGLAKTDPCVCWQSRLNESKLTYYNTGTRHPLSKSNHA
jgi:hypothetical protein